MAAARAALHKLVDTLPEQELPTATRVLEALTFAVDPVEQSLSAARLDEEPDRDDFDGGLTESRQEARDGELTSHDDIKREFGLS